MSDKINEAQKVVSIARHFAAALVAMREVVGVAASAIACERYAEKLLGDELLARSVPKDIAKRIKPLPLLQRIQGVLGDRTMQLTEICFALEHAAGDQLSPQMRRDISQGISRNTGPSGRQLFTRVRHGWYKNRNPSEEAKPSDRFSKGAFVALLWDMLGEETLTASELSARVIGKGHPADKCDPIKVGCCLSQNITRNLKCFSHVGKYTYRRKPGSERPTIDVSALVTIQAIETMLSHGPLLTAEIQRRINARRHPAPPLTAQRVTRIMCDNCGEFGYRRFERVSRGLWGLQDKKLIDLIMSIMNTGHVLSPDEVRFRMREMGHDYPTQQVGNMMRRNAGFGLLLNKVAVGKYVKTVPPEKSK